MNASELYVLWDEECKECGGFPSGYRNRGDGYYRYSPTQCSCKVPLIDALRAPGVDILDVDILEEK